ncbi:unnamed protein product [Colletotrichum noveboracense]|uniref:Heterokaryon incompatibility domain-containing protein n=1 Tax=Colletotrichum noveboracense TaxID=2664923 RepID=A0A9W4RN76_9PEZI|nr:unnamed protein product [Colletotrichum noveboracense]
MRVIDTETLKLVEFHDLPPDPYVTLSHTWGEDEVTFQEMTALSNEETSLRNRSTIESKHGFEKIKSTCAKAKKDGFSWAWADTCCIDKTSSAELSESINSMFRWYQGSAICYAYLADIPRADHVVDIWNEDNFDPAGLFRNCRWFTRGWTLQELLAPDVVEFYAADWSEIGTKSSLAARIADITKIDIDVLEGHKSIHRRCAAERLSWAASRQTARTEDVAYSLLGIMDVNMPLLYGEGKRAFIRLQETMLKEREDYSLLLPNLAIQLTSRLKEYGPLRSDTVVSLGPDSERAPPLAEDPSDFFVEDPNIWSYARISNWSAAESAMGIENHHAPYLTSRGLQICLPPAVDGSIRVMSKRFDTYCRTMNFCIVIGLSGSSVGRNYVRTRAFDLVPRDGVTRREKFVHRFQSICIIHLSKRSLTHRSTHSAITGPQDASPWWTIDTASLSRIMDVEWLEKPYDALAIGPELWHRVLALGWCTRAPGETEPFLLAVGDHWAAVLYESECRRRGIKIRALQSSGGSSLEAMLVALREKVSRKGPDRVYVRLREMAVGVSYRKIGTDEDYNTLTLTAHPRAGMNENRT